MPSLTFLDLPGEIRNQIYHILLVIRPISIPRPLFTDPPICPQILSVCRKVHDEAEQILYGCNVFIAHANLLTGLPRLRWHYDPISSPRVISIIKKYYIVVRLECDPNFSARKAMDAFSGMEELTIRVEQSAYRGSGSDYRALRLFENVRGVKETNVSGSVTGFPVYAEWLKDVMKMPEDAHILPFEGRKMESLNFSGLEI
ncbi:602d6cc0-8749-4fa7-bea4-1f3f3be19054 [Sclerotinia trifoliorum]|uniref:602d6cc0-8749-4fa7-bea4-1f3f3be19054 n=1 Tax=Sclerotinia trifoliorum TaxID=28548 RepID=A0A8H2VSF5_9HELO|nr:602d6cc0-8749-4fa7-bea4-1f3f3be19054 [Sclerotinia trifoliorum]